MGLTNVDKTLWPAAGGRPAITKRHLIKYLVSISPYLLPHLKDRPLTLSRYPDGILGEHFWQKHWSHEIPDFVRTVGITEDKGRTVREYIICDNLATLIWLGQLADIELHTWFSRVSAEPDMEVAGPSVDMLLDHPDFIIFDLDPYIYSGTRDCRGRRARAEPGRLLPGMRGGPLAQGDTGSSISRRLCEDLRQDRAAYLRADCAAPRLCAGTPGGRNDWSVPYAGASRDVTMEWAPQNRDGKVFFDYAQNARGKTLASVYSPRPHAEATVSVPLHWDELPDTYPTEFTILTVPDRIRRIGDLWSGILAEKRDLGEILGSKAGIALNAYAVVVLAALLPTIRSGLGANSTESDGAAPDVPGPLDG